MSMNYIKKLLSFVVFSTLICDAHALEPPKQVLVSDPKVVFADMYRKRVTGARGEFETKKEYEARVPPWPKDRIIYFRLPNLPSVKSYQYNPDTQTASLIGGATSEIENLRVIQEATSTFGFLLAYYPGKTSYHQAQNAFGVKAKVKLVGRTDLVFVPTNTNELSDSGLMDNKYGMLMDGDSIKVSFPLDVKTAKSVLPSLELVIGVKFSDYRAAIEGKTEVYEATIDDPLHLVVGKVGFIGEVDRVLVRNTQDNKIWKTILVRGAAKKPDLPLYQPEVDLDSIPGGGGAQRSKVKTE